MNIQSLRNGNRSQTNCRLALMELLDVAYKGDPDQAYTAMMDKKRWEYEESSVRANNFFRWILRLVLAAAIVAFLLAISGINFIYIAIGFAICAGLSVFAMETARWDPESRRLAVDWRHIKNFDLIEALFNKLYHSWDIDEDIDKDGVKSLIEKDAADTVGRINKSGTRQGPEDVLAEERSRIKDIVNISVRLGISGADKTGISYDEIVEEGGSDDEYYRQQANAVFINLFRAGSADVK